MTHSNPQNTFLARLPVPMDVVILVVVVVVWFAWYAADFNHRSTTPATPEQIDMAAWQCDPIVKGTPLKLHVRDGTNLGKTYSRFDLDNFLGYCSWLAEQQMETKPTRTPLGDPAIRDLMLAELAKQMAAVR